MVSNESGVNEKQSEHLSHNTNHHFIPKPQPFNKIATLKATIADENKKRAHLEK